MELSLYMDKRLEIVKLMKDKELQLVLEQVSDLNRHRFGRSSEKHEIDQQISFMEVDGKRLFLNGVRTIYRLHYFGK
jgi:hypothetical protein